MSLQLPVDHGSSGAWGALLNAALTSIDAHDHTTGKGVAIPSAALNINADVGLNTHALTGGLAFDLTPTTAASVATYTNALFSNSALNSGDLCWRNNAGTVIQITSGNSLNFSVTGGFGGDYSSVGALASFTDSTDTYTFQQQIGNAVRQYGKMACGDIALFEYKANPTAGVPTNAVTMKSPASLAAAYSLTWLTGLPASTLILQCSSAGQLTASNTAASALIAPDFKNNADLILQVNHQMAAPNANTRATSVGEGQYEIVLSGGTTVAGLATYPIPLRVGDQITGWTLYLRKVTDATNTISAQLHSYNATTNAFVDQSAQTNSANNPGAITLGQTGLSLTITAGTNFFVSVGMTAGAGTTDQVYHLEIKYQRP